MLWIVCVFYKVYIFYILYFIYIMRIWVDNKFYKVNRQLTIFQFCSSIGINLPCFCYHEKLTIAGNCRICLVEVSTAANLVVSCAMPLINDMRIYTHTKRVQRARESVLEFLLINHPLDCPICDQGGDVIYRIYL